MSPLMLAIGGVLALVAVFTIGLFVFGATDGGDDLPPLRTHFVGEIARGGLLNNIVGNL